MSFGHERTVYSYTFIVAYIFYSIGGKRVGIAGNGSIIQIVFASAMCTETCGLRARKGSRSAVQHLTTNGAKRNKLI